MNNFALKSISYVICFFMFFSILGTNVNAMEITTSTSTNTSTTTSAAVTTGSAATVMTTNAAVSTSESSGTLSVQSSTNALTTTSAAVTVDTQAPTVPTNLIATAITSTSCAVSWSASTDNIRVTGYDIYNGTTKIGSTTGKTTFEVTGLTPNTSYSFTVIAKDEAGNTSESSTPVVVNTLDEIIVDNSDSGFTSDTSWIVSTYTAGYYGKDYVHDGTSTADSAKWAKWTPNIVKSGNYNIYMRWTTGNNRPTAAPLEIKYNGGTDSSKTVNQQQNNGEWVLIGTYNLSVGTDNYVKILCTSAGNTIADAVKFEKATDTNVAAPTNLGASSITGTSCTLSWTASISTGVTGYDIYNGTTKIGSTTGKTTFEVTGLTPNTSYSFTVVAKDAAGNTSESSTPVVVKTLDEIIVDNSDSGFTSDTSWIASTYTAGYYGKDYVHDGTSTADSAKWAKWTPNIVKSGNYNIYMRWTTGNNRPTAAPLEIKYNGGTDSSKTVNQQQNNGEWVLIGTYNLSVGTDNYVKILCTSAGNTIADAVKFEKATDTNVAAPTNLGASSITGTSCTLSWTASISTGVTGYDIYNGRTKIGSTTGKTTFEVTGLTPNISYSFTVVAKDASGNISKASNILTVTSPVLVAGITLSSTSLSLTKGNTSKLTATVSPSNANNNAVTWTTSDNTIATVDSNGVVTAVGAGSATITCKASDGSGKSAACGVTVTSPVIVTGITLSSTSLSLLKGNTSKLTATVSPSNANNNAVTWTTSDNTIATVDSNGVVTAVGAGSATITCTANDGGGKSGSCNVTVVESDFTFDAKTGTITKYIGLDTEVVIPSTINGVSVKSIGNGAFYNCSSLTSIAIPNSVISIENFAFENCSSLTSIVIPNSVTSIGYYDVFYNCSSLTSIAIPNSVTSIGDSAFENCSSLTNITIPNSVISIEDSAFKNCSSLTNIMIPNSVTSIGKYVFLGCRSLTSITIPNSVTSIGKDVFWGCSSLTSITIQNGINNIGEGVFAGSAVRSITIPNSVTSIGDYAFEKCSSLTNLTIPNSVTSIGKDVFLGCISLTSITIPESITNIGEEVFAGSSLRSITIPNRVTSIGKDAFENCSSLRSITIPNSVTSIGECAFENCSSLTSIDIPNSVTSIASGAFMYCYRLKNLKIPIKVTVINTTTFAGCYGLTSIEIPDGVTSIGMGAFAQDDRLESIEIPDSVTSIGYYAFENCSSLASMEIPSSVKSIGDYAFENCSSLTSMDIPSSVKSIGNYAFEDCSNLTSIAIPNSVTSIGTNAFYKCDNAIFYVGSENTKQLLIDYGISESRIILTIKVNNVALNNTSLNLEKGNTSTLIATVSPSNASNSAVSWSSNNISVAIVDSNGKVTAVGAGTATITCTASDGSGKSATCNVVVADGADNAEVFDTEERTEIMSISVQSNNDIVFNEQNIRWNYIGVDVLEFLNTAKQAAANCRSQDDIDNFNATYQPTLDRIKENRNLNLSEAQLEYIFLVDPEGVRDYLYGKPEDLINDVYVRLTGKEPVYYAKTVTGWEVTDRRPGTIWEAASEVTSDAHVLLVRGDGMPHDLISLVLPTVSAGLLFIGAGEIGLVGEGIELFGARNAITMYTNGTLLSTIAFQRGLNGLTNSAQIADEIIQLEAGTWEEGWVIRGDIIDDARGNNLGHNFPIADKLENRILTSTKSLDTAAKTYQKGTTLLTKLKAFCDQLNKFNGRTWNGVTVQSSDFDSKVVEVVIPDIELSSEQLQAIIDAKTYAQSIGLMMKIIVGK